MQCDINPSEVYLSIALELQNSTRCGNQCQAQRVRRRNKAVLGPIVTLMLRLRLLLWQTLWQREQRAYAVRDRPFSSEAFSEAGYALCSDHPVPIKYWYPAKEAVICTLRQIAALVFPSGKLRTNLRKRINWAPTQTHALTWFCALLLSTEQNSRHTVEMCWWLFGLNWSYLDWNFRAIFIWSIKQLMQSNVRLIFWTSVKEALKEESWWIF